MIRTLLFSFSFFFFLGSILAQAPANDDCGGIIDLGEGPSCDGTFYSSVDATESTISSVAALNIPSCWNGAQNDVWFQFDVPANGSITDFTISVLGGDDGTGSTPITSPQIALYRGICLQDGLDEIACEQSNLGETSVALGVEGLTPGLPYFIRVNDYSATAADNWGTFQLCVDTLALENNIDDGGSTSCSGLLYDSGGPDGDYSPNENNVFTICPTEFNSCINFSLEFYNVETSNYGLGGDAINFYDNDEASGPTIASLFGADDGGGAVCYEVQASSGCLTVEFISNGSTQFEGFAGSWECSTTPCENNSPIETTTGVTEQEIIDIVSTPFTTITVTNIDCPSGAYGTFEAGDNTDLGLERGIVLTTGTAQNAEGPNNDPGGFNTDNYAPGDDDLNTISMLNGDAYPITFDACIVELDVFVATDELSFEYIFGSEEYPEYVGGTVNDIFALLISGPGITGEPLLNNQENIAVLPNGSGTAVEINSVNNLMNWEYYRNNNNGQSVQYDGLTSDYLGSKKSLTARSTVTPCETYHLKFAIADKGDGVWDSGVFISEIRGGTPTLAVNFSSGVDYLIENCTTTPDELLVQLSSPLEDTTTFNVVIGGTATQGVDYDLTVPTTLTFLPGELSKSFPLSVLVDAIDEGIETIEISLVNNFGCGDIVYTTVTVEIHDEPEVLINVGADTAFICKGNEIQLEATGANTYFWTPVPIYDNPGSPNPIVDVTTSQWAFVQGTVGNCSVQDSIYLQIIDPQVTVSALDTELCSGESTTLTAANNVNGQSLSWSPDNGTLSGINDQITIATPLATTTYTATIEIAGCEVSDQVTINVNSFDPANLTTTDTLLCQGQSLILAAPAPAGSTTNYTWTPDEFLSSATAVDAIATPEVTTTYTLMAESQDNFCSETYSVTVEVIPAEVNITDDETIFLCEGESVDLFAESTVPDVMWTPADQISPSTGSTVVATPEESTWFFATSIVGACTVVDSVFVQVDSLPDMTIEAIPDQAVYCQDQLVSIVSPSYNSQFYPDITHQWSPGIGAQTDLDNLNLVVTATETTNYIRITTNGGCIDTSSFLMTVIDPQLETNLDSITICEGEEVTLEVFNGEEGADYSWFPGTGLTCPDCDGECDVCLTANAMPSTTTTYTVVTTIQGCQTSANFLINVEDAPDIWFETSVDPEREVPQGESIDITALTAPDASATGTFSWAYNSEAISATGPNLVGVTPINVDNTYSVTVTGANGCSAENFVYIVGLPPRYQIPNAFTPDGDGTNDVFKIVYLGLITVENFLIYNRWGELVYESNDIDQGWNGMHNDKPAISDVYAYYIEIKLPNGQTDILKGDLTLIR